MPDTSYAEMLNKIDLKINRLEKEIFRLRAFRNTFVKEFSSEEPSLFSQAISTNDAVPLHELHPDKPPTRKQTVVNLLKCDGALTRKDIAIKTKFTHGTLSYVLNDKKLFKNTYGKWKLLLDKQ